MVYKLHGWWGYRRWHRLGRHRGCVASFFFGRTASNSGGQIKVYWFLFCFVLLCTTIFIQTISILKTPATMTREHRHRSSRTTTNLSVCVFVCLVWFGFSKLRPGKSSAMRADLFLLCQIHSCRRPFLWQGCFFRKLEPRQFNANSHCAAVCITPWKCIELYRVAAPKMVRYEALYHQKNR